MYKGIGLLVFCIIAACSPKGYKSLMKTKSKKHPIIVHTLEYEIAQHMEDANTDEAKYARELWAGFEPAFDAYKPSLSTCKAIFKNCQNRKITYLIIGGNWCSDTRTQLPILTKVLHTSAVNHTNITYYRVNKDKQLLDLDTKQPPIQISYTKVPTLFVVENNKIIGTIIETPSKTWEADLLSILKLVK